MEKISDNTPVPPADSSSAPDTPPAAARTDFFEQEISRLRGEVEQLTSDRDGLARQLDSMIRRGKVGELAARHHFTDPDYLAFLCEKHQLDLDSEEAVEHFMAELSGKCPKLFRVELFSGVPRQNPPGEIRAENHTPGNPAAENIRNNNPADRLVGLLENAPELK